MCFRVGHDDDVVTWQSSDDPDEYLWILKGGQPRAGGGGLGVDGEVVKLHF